MEIDWPIVLCRVLFALIGGCLGSLVIALPMTLINSSGEVEGWGLGVLLAGVVVGMIVGWRTPEWADW